MNLNNKNSHKTEESPFQMPVALPITGRSSTITNVFVNSIIPVIPPSREEICTALEILDLDPNNVKCAYCGDVATEWDHLHPIVKNKKPTGYISEIHNLVPACGKCNQSKGNKDWLIWMESDAALSPKSRGISDIENKKYHLQEYEKWGPRINIDFASVVGKNIWDEHWKNCEKIQDMLRDSQIIAQKIKTEVEEKLRSSK